MNPDQRMRRRLLASFAGLALPSVARLASADDGLLPATPSDAEGPFYPVEPPRDTDNDLLRVTGRNDTAPGRLAYVVGSVTDRRGTPIDGARVEIWQCDAGGVYHHPKDPGQPDRRFQGFGAMVTDRAGAWHFRTLRPVPYSGRTPHIHFRVSAPGFERLTTQLYVAEEHERNAEDFLYRRHSETERDLVTSAFEPLPGDPAGAVAARFGIVLG